MLINKANRTETISILLSLLFFYTGFSKFFNMDLFMHFMNSQPFPKWAAALFIYLLPSSELLIAGCLLFSWTRKMGLYSAGILFFLFILYSAATSFHLFSDRLPCPCGGILTNLSWKQHIYLNSFLFLLTVLGMTHGKQKIKQPALGV